MNVLNKLTFKDLLLNKKRSIVTIIGICLSVALICAVAGMVTSFQKTLVEATKAETGYFHTVFMDVKKEDVKYIENRNGVKFYYEIQSKGYSKYNTGNENKPYAYLVEMDKTAFENHTVRLEEGRFPTNSDEIVIQRSMDKNLKIGDKITLNVGKRLASDDSSLNQLNPLNEDERLEGTETREYTIVGIVESLLYNMEDYSSPGYTVISYLSEKQDALDIYVTFKKVKDFRNITSDILDNTSLTTDNKDYNMDLIRFEGAGYSDNNMSMIYTMAIIVIIIIIISSVFVIKNSFSISITEKYKQYGMLASIGATKKQIRKNVLFEGFLLGIIAIPLGILCGLLAVFILVNVINLILKDFLSGALFQFGITWMPIIVSIIVSTITIYLSCIIPAIKASKVSPIEAIRSNNDVKIKNKKLRTPKWIKKIFKIGGDISYKNLKRSSKKYRTTIISLVVSVSIFIGLSSFIDFGFRIATVYYKNLDYDIRITGTDEQIDAFTKLNNIESYQIVRQSNLVIDKSYANENYYDYRIYNDGHIYINLITMNEEAYKKYLDKVGVKDRNKAILTDELEYSSNEKRTVKNVLNVKDKLQGQVIGKSTVSDEELEKLSEEEQDNTYPKYDVEFDIVKSSTKPIGFEFNQNILLIVSPEKMKEIEDKQVLVYTEGLYLTGDKTGKLSDNVNKYVNDNYKDDASLNIDDFSMVAKVMNALVLIISIFLYGFIGVITLIGVTNIFNTITTNMILRSKEFAMLKSVGMTTKEFNKMINLESIFYGFKSLAIGIPIGLILSYLIYYGMTQGLSADYILPLRAIIVSIIFVFIIVGLTMRYSLKKINKQNIIETIRNDNI